MSIAWCGMAFVDLALGEFYHPMAARGDLFRPLRQGAFPATILTAIAMFTLWLWLRPLAPRIYLIGLLIVAAIALLPLLPRIDSGYRQVYFLDKERYEIPWQYSPYNGSPDRGGQYFLIKVSVQDLAPRYAYQGDVIIIGKAVDYNYGKGGESPKELCTMGKYNFHCQWQRGNSVFIASGDADLFPSEVSDLMISASELLDSFEVSAPQD